MMKSAAFLFAFFILSACAPEISRQIPAIDPLPNSFQEKKETLASNYEKQMQTPMILLWPELISDKNQDMITQVIVAAKNISEVRNAYDRDKKIGVDQYKLNNCDCALYDNCADANPLPAETIKTCEDIEIFIQNNDQRISVLAAQLDKMKNSLLASGGFWIQAEPTEISMFSFDFATNSLRTGAWQVLGSPTTNSFKALYSKAGPQILLTDESGESLGTASLEASVSLNVLNFQGDISLKFDGKMRKGIFIFQQELKSNP